MALSSAMEVTVTQPAILQLPAVVGVKTQVYHKAATYFKHSGILEIRRRDLLPGRSDQMKAQRGSIAIYSVLGRW